MKNLGLTAEQACRNLEEFWKRLYENKDRIDMINGKEFTISVENVLFMNEEQASKTRIMDDNRLSKEEVAKYLSIDVALLEDKEQKVPQAQADDCYKASKEASKKFESREEQIAFLEGTIWGIDYLAKNFNTLR